MTLEKNGHDVARKDINDQSERSSSGNVNHSDIVSKEDSLGFTQSLAHEKRPSEDEDKFCPVENERSELVNGKRRVNASISSNKYGSSNNLGEQSETAVSVKGVHATNITEKTDISSSSIQPKEANSNKENIINQRDKPSVSDSEIIRDSESQKINERLAAVEKAHVRSGSKEITSESNRKENASQVNASDSKNATDDEWQEMPAVAEYDIYDDYGRLIARGSVDEQVEVQGYNNLGSAAKGYTRVQIDEDAQSATSMDDNTAYLFKETGKDLMDDEEEARNPMEQMQATKDLLTDGQRIAYVGITRLATVEMINELNQLERTKKIKKEVDMAVESMKTWSLEIMVRLHGHMNISSAGILTFLSVTHCIWRNTNRSRASHD